MKMPIKEMSFLVVMTLLLGFTTKPPAPPKPPAPSLRFDREICDFGRIPQGEPVKALFRFFNDGGGPLVIYSVEAGCGCTTAIFTREAVSPGHSGTIVVTFDAATSNRFEKQIVVRSNTRTEVKVLYIRGTVVNRPN